MRRPVRKITAILLCAVMTVLFAACGADGGKESAGAQAENNKGAGAQEASEGQTEGSNVSSMGRYMESAYPLPEGNGWQSRTLAVLEDGSLAYFDAQIGLHTSADEGKSWEKSKDILKQLPEGAYITGAAIAPDSGTALAYSIFSDAGNPEKTAAVYIDAEGKLTETDGSFGDGDRLQKVFFGKDGAVYGLSIRSRVCRIDTQAGEIKQLFDASSGAEMLAFSGKKLLALENEGVAIYDLEQGVLTDSDPVLDDFVKENMGGKLGHTSDAAGGWLLDGPDGVIYVVCSVGVYRHVLGGNAMEQLIDGGFSSLSDPTVGMCSMLLLEDGDFLLLTMKEEFVRFTYDPNQPTIPEKQMKIYSLTENMRLRQAISAFQKKNPDVYVKYETGMAEGTALTVVDAQKNLNVELMSGSGPDVILFDGLDQNVYAQKGMLADLSGLLDGLSGENALLTNITETYREENGVFVVPAGFQLNLISGRAELTGRVKDMKSLADVVEELRAEFQTGTITGCYNPKWLLAVLADSDGRGWLDGKELDTDRIADFLTQAKRIYQADMAGADPSEVDRLKTAGEYHSIGMQADMAAIERAQIALGLAGNKLMDIGILEYLEKERGFSFDLWRGADGAGFIPVNKLGIAVNTAQRALAEDFISLILSPEIQNADVGDGFPVNIHSFDKLCEWDEAVVGSSYRLPDGTEKEMSYGSPNEKTVAHLKELVQKADTNLEANAVVREAVLENAEAVLNGHMTVEEGVDAIRREVSIYLTE